MTDRLDHLHHAGDGRGPRHVFLNGKEIRGVVFADTEAGIIRRHTQPICIGEHGEVVTELLTGRVTVAPFRTDKQETDDGHS